MPGSDAFEVEGLIVEARANGTFRVQLPNGHRLLAFVPGKRKTELALGAKVRVKLSPFDLSVGRILLEGKQRARQQDTGRVSSAPVNK